MICVTGESYICEFLKQLNKRSISASGNMLDKFWIWSNLHIIGNKINKVFMSQLLFVG